MLYFNIELSHCGTVVAFNGNRDGITAFVQQLNCLDCSKTFQLTVYPEVLRAWSSSMLKKREPGWSPKPAPCFGVLNRSKRNRNTLFEQVWLERVEQPERFLAVRAEDKTLWIQVNDAGLTELKELLLHCRDEQYWFLVPRATSLPHVLRAPIGTSSAAVTALEFICAVPGKNPWLHTQDGLCWLGTSYDGLIKGNENGAAMSLPLPKPRYMNFEIEPDLTTLVFNGDTEGMLAMSEQLSKLILSDQPMTISCFPDEERIWLTRKLFLEEHAGPEDPSPYSAWSRRDDDINTLIKELVLIPVADSEHPIIAPWMDEDKVYIYINASGLQKLSEVCNACVHRSHWIYVTYPTPTFEQLVGPLPYRLRWPQSYPIPKIPYTLKKLWEQDDADDYSSFLRGECAVNLPFGAIEFIRTDADKSVWFHFDEGTVNGSPLGLIWFAQRLWDFAESGADCFDFEDTPWDPNELPLILFTKEDPEMFFQRCSPSWSDASIDVMFSMSALEGLDYVGSFQLTTCRSFKFRKVNFSVPIYSMENREDEEDQYIFGNESGFRKLAEFFVSCAYTFRNQSIDHEPSHFLYSSDTLEYFHFLGTAPWSILGGSQFSKITCWSVIGGLWRNKLYKDSIGQDQNIVNARILTS